MPAKRNSPRSYDAKLNRPAPEKQGILKVGALGVAEDDTSLAEVKTGASGKSGRWLIFTILIALVGGALVLHHRKQDGFALD